MEDRTCRKLPPEVEDINISATSPLQLRSVRKSQNGGKKTRVKRRRVSMMVVESKEGLNDKKQTKSKNKVCNIYPRLL